MPGSGSGLNGGQFTGPGCCSILPRRNMRIFSVAFGKGGDDLGAVGTVGAVAEIIVTARAEAARLAVLSTASM